MGIFLGVVATVALVIGLLLLPLGSVEGRRLTNSDPRRMVECGSFLSPDSVQRGCDQKRDSRKQLTIAVASGFVIIGVAAVVSGGVASRDLRQLAGSEIRQQAALHAAAPFGLIALSGYGRMPIPRHLWDLLVAAEGRPAGISPESRTLLIGGDPDPLLVAARGYLGRLPGPPLSRVHPHAQRAHRVADA